MRKIPNLFILALCLTFTLSCKKDKDERLPLVTTSSVTGGIKEGICVGVLYADGDAEVTEKGICWATHAGPRISDKKLTYNGNSKTFTLKITGLEARKTYYACAYAKNKFGVSYGKVASFTTQELNYPLISLYSYFQPSNNSVQLQLNMYQENPLDYVTGICWSTNPLPSIQNSTLQLISRKANEAVPFNQTFLPLIQNLNESTEYHARAFCSTPYGVSYSNKVTFTTKGTHNPVSFSVQAVGHTSVSCFVHFSGTDLSTVKSTGVCWNDTGEPTIADNKLSVSYGASSIGFNIESLQSNRTYYFRAYITTATKTTYGPQEKMLRTFKSTVTDINGNVYNTVEINGKEWMASNLRVSSFNNGTSIQLATNYNQWTNNVNGKIPTYCYYYDDASLNATYGKLYPSYVAFHPNIAPVGWHVATVDDWQEILTTVGVLDLCADDGSWISSPGRNPYRFSLLPAGFWEFGYQSAYGKSRFWTVPGSSDPYPKNSLYIDSYNSYNFYASLETLGYSIRCVKN